MSSIPIYGNYHGYYTKRPFVNDERLALLPVTFFAGARVLDVGCNEGWVTCEIAQSHKAHFVVGVDIDGTLIQAAWRRRRTVWSLQAPSRPLQSELAAGGEEESHADSMGAGIASILDASSASSTKAKKRKRQHIDPEPESEPPIPTTGAPSRTTRSYFPASCEHEFGSLPIPPSSNRGKTAFPHNLSFRTADWTKEEIPEDGEGYDVVVAFSISKWIHLNSGDTGLKDVFRRVYAVLKPGGSFVLEPQPWESYAKARRMDPKLKENAKSLRIRPDDFESILQDVGFGPVKHYGSIGQGGFHRPVDVYTKI
ncbi:Bicoid-interacting protein 3-domain-containing protein [Crassisporium funariophilum]|nr:Bicoid-interacting protein 3-domain-containing protein [Crassisporium funariophilum]